MSRWISLSLGGRVSVRRNPVRTFSCVVAPPAIMRRASACAASMYTGSFIVTSAWSGVFERLRRRVQTSRFGASKVTIEGYGAVRRHSV